LPQLVAEGLFFFGFDPPLGDPETDQAIAVNTSTIDPRIFAESVAFLNILRLLDFAATSLIVRAASLIKELA
jgi:hypothetical protein